MVYLQYQHRESGLRTPEKISLCVRAPESVDGQVQAEIESLFPRAHVSEVGPQAFVPACDWAILAYYKSRLTYSQLERWARRQLPSVSVAFAFYCLDERGFEIIPRDRLKRWARRRRLLIRATKLRDRYPDLWYRLGAVFSRCGC